MVYYYTMALNIKNAEVERLAGEVARMAGETKTEAVRQALLDRKGRLSRRAHMAAPGTRARRFLEAEVWPYVPAAELGRRLTSGEEDAILGYGPGGA